MKKIISNIFVLIIISSSILIAYESLDYDFLENKPLPPTSDNLWSWIISPVVVIFFIITSSNPECDENSRILALALSA